MESSESDSEPDADEVLSRIPELDSEDEEALGCCGGACSHRVQPFLSNRQVC